MKTAVGIIGVGLGLIVLMQACSVTGLSQLAQQQDSAEAGSIGMVVAVLMFLGGAFSFGVPRLATAMFGLAFLASLPARAAFPDMAVWGGVSIVLGLMLSFSQWKKPKPNKGKENQ